MIVLKCNKAVLWCARLCAVGVCYMVLTSSTLHAYAEARASIRTEVNGAVLTDMTIVNVSTTSERVTANVISEVIDNSRSTVTIDGAYTDVTETVTSGMQTASTVQLLLQNLILQLEYLLSVRYGN